MAAGCPGSGGGGSNGGGAGGSDADSIRVIEMTPPWFSRYEVGRRISQASQASRACATTTSATSSHRLRRLRGGGTRWVIRT